MQFWRSWFGKWFRESALPPKGELAQLHKDRARRKESPYYRPVPYSDKRLGRLMAHREALDKKAKG